MAPLTALRSSLSPAGAAAARHPARPVRATRGRILSGCSPVSRASRGDRLPRRAQAGASCSGRSPSPTPRAGSSFGSIENDEDFKQSLLRDNPCGIRPGCPDTSGWELPRLPAELQLRPPDATASGSAVGFRSSSASRLPSSSGSTTRPSLRNNTGTASLADGREARFRGPRDPGSSASAHGRPRSRSSATDVQDEDTSDLEADSSRAFPFRGPPAAVPQAVLRSCPDPSGPSLRQSSLSSDRNPNSAGTVPTSAGRDDQPTTRPATPSEPAHPRGPVDADRLVGPRPPASKAGSDGIKLWALPSSASGVGWADLREVFVILFGVSGSGASPSPALPGSPMPNGEEGIYSLRAVNRADGLPTDTIIAFESQADAERYAGQLEGTFGATHLSKPAVCSIPPPELLSFCAEAGYSVRLEPTGSDLVPPDFNVGTTDWERSQRLRAGEFSVLEEEPFTATRLYMTRNPLPGEEAYGGLGSAGSGEDEPEVPLPGMERHLDYLSDLDRMKLQLERLLVQGEDSEGSDSDDRSGRQA